MLSLKIFLDGLADENHPFRKGPDLREGSTLSLDERKKPVKMGTVKSSGFKEQQERFYFMRINKN